MPVNSYSDIAGKVKTAMVKAATIATGAMLDPDHDLLVRYGQPSREQLEAFDDIVGVTRVRAHFDPATMSATKRNREGLLTISVLVSVFRPGGEDMEQVAGDRAYALLNAVEEYVRITDTTLGQLVRYCFCVDHDSDGISDQDVLARGRCIEIDATFAAPFRLTS